MQCLYIILYMILEGIKNIIFDLGEVLVGIDEQRCMAAFDRLGAHRISDYVRHHRTEDMFMDVEIGRSTQEQFCDEIRRVAGISATDSDIVDAWNQLLTDIPNSKKQKILQLHEHHRVFLLSNTNYMHWRYCADHLMGYHGHPLSDFFDRIFLSYKMHMVKPHADIFQTVLAETGIKASDTLFIDDNADNCATANRLGIRTLLHSKDNDWTTQL